MIPLHGYEHLYIISDLEIGAFIIVGVVIALFFLIIGYFIEKQNNARKKYLESLTKDEALKYVKYKERVL